MFKPWALIEKMNALVLIKIHYCLSIAIHNIKLKFDTL